MTITLYRSATGEQVPLEGIPALRTMLSAGQATLDDYCFYPGASGWQLLRELQITDDRLIPLPPLPPQVGSPPKFSDHSTSGRHDHTLNLNVAVESRHNVMAYVAFALGCLAFVFNFFAAIPGIICARIALKQCDEDPSLLGRGWARAGLILSNVIIFGYLALVVLGALFYLALILWGSSHR